MENNDHGYKASAVEHRLRPRVGGQFADATDCCQVSCVTIGSTGSNRCEHADAESKNHEEYQ